VAPADEPMPEDSKTSGDVCRLERAIFGEPKPEPKTSHPATSDALSEPKANPRLNLDHPMAEPKIKEQHKEDVVPMPEDGGKARHPATSVALSEESLADPRRNLDHQLAEPKGNEQHKEDVVPMPEDVVLRCYSQGDIAEVPMPEDSSQPTTTGALSGEPHGSSQSLKRKVLFATPKGKCIVSYHCVFVMLSLLLVDLFCMGVVNRAQGVPKNVPNVAITIVLGNYCNEQCMA